MQVCQLEQYGVPVWSPSPLTANLMATGTWTNGTSSDPQSLIRISSYDINKGFNVQGMTISPTKFSSLDWTDFKDEYGIIAGGMSDGAITLWDARKIIETYSGNNPSDLKMGRGCVSAANIHNGVPVTSIEFNPHKKNLLASGGAEVIIQDIGANMKAPNVFKPGDTNYHQGSRITSISWNRLVSHILASASENGKIVVWDLKVNKSIFQFTEPSQQQMGADDYYDYFGGSGMDQQNAQKRQQQSRETSMVWNPENPTQFLVANDDDQNPTLNIWDLRNPDYPVATFSDLHYNGILSISWSQTDPSLIVSSAKDYRTVILNSKTGERILEFPTTQAFQKVSWSRPLKGKVVTMDTEGNTSVLSYQPEGLFSAPNRPFAVPQTTNYAPNWLQPKCGARFGFGNRLVTFGAGSRSIKIQHKSTQPTLAARIQAFDQALETIELAKLLDQKIAESQNDFDRLEFTTMKCIYKKDFSELLKLFGYDQTKIVKEVEKYLGKKLLKPQEQAPQQQQQPQTIVKQEFQAMSAESAADFFSQLGSKSQAAAASGQNNQSNNNNEEQKLDSDDSQRDRQMTFVTETVSKNTNWDEGAEGIIKRNLLIGNLEYAAEVALKAGRTAEALLIAEAGGDQLFEKIKEEYFVQQKDSYIKLFLRSIVQDDFKELISQQALHHKHANWKESLAYFLSYLEGPDMKTLVHELADELLNKKKDINSAIICYMISQSLEIVIDLWKKRAHFFMKKGLDRNEVLYQLFEKAILFKTVSVNTKVLLDMDLILSDMGDYMASEDLKHLAMKYLEFGNPKQPNVAFIKDRVYNSDSTRQFQKQFARPSIPYQVEKIRVHMSIYANQQVQQKNQQNRGGPIQQQTGRQGGQAAVVQNQQQQQQHNVYNQQQQVQQQQYDQRQNQYQGQTQQPIIQNQIRPNAGVQPVRQPNRGNFDPTIVANFGYNEANAVPLRQTTPPQNQFGGPRPNLPVQHQATDSTIHRAPLPNVQAQVRQQLPLQGADIRPRIFNPNDMQKRQEEEKQIAQPPPIKGGQQAQPRQQIRPPPPGNIRPPVMQPPHGGNQNQVDQGRPTSSQQHQNMPPPMGGLGQPPIRQPPAPVMNQLNQGPPIQSSPPNFTQEPPQPIVQPPGPASGPIRPAGGIRPPVGAPPGIGPAFRPPMGGPGGLPQNNQQPTGGVPFGGPRSMQRQGSQQQNQQMMAGSGGSGAAGGSSDPVTQEVITGLSNLFNVYASVEQNAKVKSETEAKFILLRDRLSEGQSISQGVVQSLKQITQYVEQNNFNMALNIHKDLINKSWQESKDWANALKVLITFKQRFAQ